MNDDRQFPPEPLAGAGEKWSPEEVAEECRRQQKSL